MFVYCVCSLCAFVIIAAPSWWQFTHPSGAALHSGLLCCVTPVPSLWQAFTPQVP